MTKKDKSFIAEARREQIIKAAIEVLNDIGYVKISLAKIAKQANISTGLISYHFTDKEDLLNHTLMYLASAQLIHIKKQVEEEKEAFQQLIAFIRASLDYQKQYYKNNVAMLEIVFNARDAENTPYYKLINEGEDPIYTMVEEIVRQGQQEKVFSTAIQPNVISILINGAISESTLMHNEDFDIENYQQELIKMVKKMVQ